MPKPRSHLISLTDTPYYHITGRCVRRAFLCGFDHATQTNFEHRRQWLLDHLALLSTMFAIDVAAYAIMSNHYHLVLHINAKQANSWSDAEVVKRWKTQFKIPDYVSGFLNKTNANKAANALAKRTIDTWRERLFNISWFMRCFNEHIARKANKEDHCTGHFWESRFHSQALLDEKAVLQCMAYVDLNPIRAKMAQRPEQSDYTSLQERLIQAKLITTGNDTTPRYSTQLQGFVERLNNTSSNDLIPFSSKDYFELVDWLGRHIRDDKRGYIPNTLAPIFERLNIDPEKFANSMKRKRSRAVAIGNQSATQAYLKTIQQQWIKNRPDWV